MKIPPTNVTGKTSIWYNINYEILELKVLLFVTSISTFRPLCSPIFYTCLSTDVTFMKFPSEYFIQSTVAGSSRSDVQVLVYLFFKLFFSNYRGVEGDSLFLSLFWLKDLTDVLRAPWVSHDCSLVKIVSCYLGLGGEKVLACRVSNDKWIIQQRAILLFQRKKKYSLLLPYILVYRAISRIVRPRPHQKKFCFSFQMILLWLSCVFLFFLERPNY